MSESPDPRIARLETATDEKLYERFWQLADRLVSPLTELARTHTSPAVERSVLLRMGFNSLQASAFVDRCVREGQLGRGAGAILLRHAQRNDVSLERAFEELVDAESWEKLLGVNLMSYVHFCKAAIPHFERPGCSIVNVASVRSITA